MNVAALIFSLIGAALSLFQGFIVVPFLGEISLWNIWVLILSNLSETGHLISEVWSGISGAGETIVFIIIFLLVLGFLFMPVNAVMSGAEAFMRKEKDDDKPWEGLKHIAILCVIAAGVLYFAAESIIRSISEGMGEEAMFIGAMLPAHSMFLAYVPLIWAVCFGIASACTYSDMQEQHNQQEQLASSSGDPKVTENTTMPEMINTKKTYEPVLGVETEALIKRANIFLEDEDFDEADRYFEQALNQDPESSSAYIGKLLVARKVHNIDELLNLPINLTNEKFFLRALKFAEGEEKNRLEEYVQSINGNAKAEYPEQSEQLKQAGISLKLLNKWMEH